MKIATNLQTRKISIFDHQKLLLNIIRIDLNLQSE